MKERDQEDQGKLVAFIKAACKAVYKDEKEFSCPICGGRAKWDITAWGHLSVTCDTCNFAFID